MTKFDTVLIGRVCETYILELIASLQYPCLKQRIPLEADLIKLMSYLMYVSDVCH